MTNNKELNRLDYSNEITKLLENASKDLSSNDFKTLICMIRDTLNVYEWYKT